MIRGIWTRETVALLIVASALPVAVAWLWEEGITGAGRLVFALILGGLWQTLFTIVRAQAPSPAGLVSALAMAMVVPEVGPWQIALGISFGFVFGELIFGGWGRSVLNPAVVAAMFLGFGFPTAEWPLLAVQVGWAVIPAAALLLVFGVMPWRVLAAALIVLVVAGGFSLDLVTTGVSFALVFFVCDPATAPSMPLGRWLHGALFGVLIAVFAAIWDTSQVQIAVSAAFLSSLAAPLLDEIATAIWLAARRYRHG
ncbi:RnfABCDGE type electron transport complex subunit D [Microvirga guangxiensis]|uniref:Na+-transporting NADH:ubiquinone oxidoreductase subunit B n=1 Tax=Microvirga guangxiensis TaxID=549386 RepID=A0A1G5K9Y9_9HYPH|nr:RnfABCDGE type electron transport complex subunit D [Microvirga guangxiensis]SCY97415.1 Na+-transporting NADH:ubiquinone oxidoreductase subunit B [Microvirga guangxiensis]